MPEERRRKLDNQAIKCCFISCLEGMKGWPLCVPEKIKYIESAHERWSDEKQDSNVSRTQPIPDPSSSSSIDRILNGTQTMGYKREVQGLFSSLCTKFRLGDPSFTLTVFEQDARVAELNAMSAGTAMQLPQTYSEAVNLVKNGRWRATRKLTC